MADIPLITTHSITKSYGHQPLFRDISLSLLQNERLGLIGPNGSGKSTLLKILSGIVEPDVGEISRRRNTSLVYLPQEDVFDPEATVGNILFSLLPAGLENWERDKRVEEIRSLVEFDDMNQKTATLSGGWRKRLAIGQALIQAPDIILMDEPTNHLDLEGILWLEKLLQSTQFAFILVSHDRFFLENATNRIVELNKRYTDGYLKVDGNYSKFVEMRARHFDQLARREISLSGKARREIEWLRRGPKARTTKARSRIDSANRLIDDLSDVKERNIRTAGPRIDFDGTERKTKKLLDVKKLRITRADKLLFSELELTLSPNTCIGIMGRNGSGKSTLLNLLNGKLSADAGYIKRADAVKIVTFDQERDLTDESLSLQQALVESGDSVIYRGKSIHIISWAKRFLFTPDQLEMPVSQLSGGEKARVLLANLMLRPAEILLLDEPTNDLDIPTLEILEENLKDFPGAIVLISHDRFLVDRLCDSLIYLNGEGEVRYFAEYSQLYQYQSGRTKSGNDDGRTAVRTVKPHQIKRALQKEISRIERQIEKAEEELDEIKREMDDPNNQSNAGKLEMLFRQQNEIEEKIAGLYQDWEKLESG